MARKRQRRPKSRTRNWSRMQTVSPPNEAPHSAFTVPIPFHQDLVSKSISCLGQKETNTPLSTNGSASKLPAKRTKTVIKDENNEEETEDEDEEPVRKRSRRTGPQDGRGTRGEGSPKSSRSIGKPKAQETKIDSSAIPNMSGSKAIKSEETSRVVMKESKLVKQVASSKDAAASTPVKSTQKDEEDEATVKSEVEDEAEESDDEEDEKPEVAAKAREKVQSTLQSHGKDPYPDWKAGEPVPYAALCTTFSLIEMTTKRLIISAHCSLFLRQVLRLTPQDLLPTIQLMVNKLAADYAGIELGIGESLIMKAIGESTGRSLATIKADQNEIGDLGLVAAKSRSNQPTMFKPKALTVRGVLNGLMGIATVQGSGSQTRKVDGIKKLLSAADAALAGKGNKGVDITKEKGGASEAKYIVRFLEGKLRLGLAEKTVLVALAHAMVIHETEKEGKKVPSSEQLANGEAILKTVYRYAKL